MKTLVFFLEEPSARAMLEGLLPRLVPPDWDIRYIIFKGKQDLEKQLPKKLKAWNQPDCTFVVLRDKDNSNCISIRQNLIYKCLEAQKTDVLIRIAIHELESWYLGTLKQLKKGWKLKNYQSYKTRKNSEIRIEWQTLHKN